MTKLAIGINLRRCIGCNTCAVACKMQNNVPDGMLWNRVLTEGCEQFDGAEGVYAPTVPEIVLTLGIFALGLCAFTVLCQKLLKK